MNAINTFIRSKSISKIVIDKNTLSFKSDLFELNNNWNVFVFVNEGKITLETYESYSLLSYDFSMFRLYILSAVMSIVMGLLLMSLYTFITWILFLGVLNYLLTIFRQKRIFKKIVRDIQKIE